MNSMDIFIDFALLTDSMTKYSEKDQYPKQNEKQQTRFDQKQWLLSIISHVE